MPTDWSVLACRNTATNQIYHVSGGKRMIPKYSVKRPYTVLVAVVLVIVLGVVSLTRMTTDLFAGNESAICDRCHDGCRGKSGGSGKRCDIADRSGNGDDFQY